MPPFSLALAVDGHSYGLVANWQTSGAQDPALDGGPSLRSVAVVGLGYVGLPTALALRRGSLRVIGFDIDDARLAAIKRGEVDLLPTDREHLAESLQQEDFTLTTEPAVIGEADAVIVCVPTPVDANNDPDLTALRAACDTVLSQLRPGQVILLTSTSYVGTTRDLVVEPLRQRGVEVGEDVFVAFSPERIDPGNAAHLQRETPRVVGGVTGACTARAARLVSHLTAAVHTVSSPEAAELCKLYENIFRAVCLALANEVADACGTLGLDPIEVTIAAATKPYGFLATLPGPGVGGHCIPCDPHYLLSQLRASGTPVPLLDQAMTSIAQRPLRVVDRVVDLLTQSGRDARGARVLVAGVAYKPNVRDLRGSPAIAILNELRRRGTDVRYYDPLVPQVALVDGEVLTTEKEPEAGTWDLVLLHTLHPDVSYSWVSSCPVVLDGTYRFPSLPHRHLL